MPFILTKSFYPSVILWLLILIAADSMYLYKTNANRSNGILESMFLKGLQDGPAQRVNGIPPYFIIVSKTERPTTERACWFADPRKKILCIAQAAAFLKGYIVVAYESQSFVGVSAGSHDATGIGSGPDTNRYCLIVVSCMECSIEMYTMESVHHHR